MNSLEWLQYFEQNRKNRTEPSWHIPSPLDTHTQKILCRSLSHFQLGESGEGTHLLRHAQEQAPDDVNYRAALALFIAEEKEHARLLAQLVARFGGRTIRRHWTHGMFRLLRHGLGLNFEIQVLVIAELIGTAYYKMLKARARDPVLDEVCGLFLRDEAQHIAFHVAWLGAILSRWLPAERAVWSLQFQALFTAAARAAWIDHAAALEITGGYRREFFQIARSECIRFLGALDEAETRRSPFAQIVLN